MPETHPSTTHVEKGERAARGRVSDPRAAEVGLSQREAERLGEGVGYAEERNERDVEHKTGRTDDGSAT